MNPKSVVVSAGVAVAFSTVPVQAGTVVASLESSLTADVNGTFTELNPSFGMVRDFLFGDPAAEIWLAEDVALTAGDVGTTFVYSGSQVDAIRAQFADGDILDVIGWGIDPLDFGFPGIFQGWLEDDFDNAPNLPDDATLLAATGFDEIHVTILAYEDPIPFTDEFGNQLTHFRLDTRFDFVVTNIPAPGSLAFLGVAGLAGRRRRRCV